MRFYDDGTYSGVDGDYNRYSSWKVIKGKMYFKHYFEEEWRAFKRESNIKAFHDYLAESALLDDENHDFDLSLEEVEK